MAATWTTVSFNFAAFDPLKEPLKGLLIGLETLSSILEALLDFIKVFLIDVTNPIKAVIALLLAAIRAIINQITAAGFAVLLVHPDFSRPDFAGVLNSVSGSYSSFESKVVGKFFDASDAFRPQYPPGSSVAMIVLYIGAEDPGSLFTQIFALLQLLKHPINLALPAPVAPQVLPVLKSGSAISQFKDLFNSDLDKALVVQWRMPQAASGQDISGVLNQSISIYNSYRFPSFIVERIGPFPANSGSPEPSPTGELVQVDAASPTLGPSIDRVTKRYNFPQVQTKITVREENGNVYRDFPNKFAVDSGAEAQGDIEGTYRYLDNDPNLIAGKAYYYRIRAYFGNPQAYLALKGAASVAASKSILRRSNNNIFLRFPPSFTLGPPSRVVSGFVPRPSPQNAAFNAYQDLFDAIRAGILLNFELPTAGPKDSVFRQQQKTGWGTLGQIGGQIGPLKAAATNSADLITNVLFTSTVRRLANPILTTLSNTPELSDLLIGKWTGGVAKTVSTLLDPNSKVTWKFVGVVNGITTANQAKIEAYLALEDSYVEGHPFNGPYPVTGAISTSISAQDRLDLADFLRTALSVVSAQTSYLAWYSMTLGDLFPAFIPYMFDFEQFILAMLKAVESALSEITDIIETVLQKVKALEQLLQTILDILDLLDVKISLGVLASSSTNGSASSLAQDIITSQNKPSDSPSGLHSGLVLTFGGPGQGTVAAFSALKFILTIGAGPAGVSI